MWDGQLTVRLEDKGGVDPYVVLNGLEVAWAGPDTRGPQVIAASPGAQNFPGFTQSSSPSHGLPLSHTPRVVSGMQIPVGWR